MRFFLAQSMKLSPRLVYISIEGKTEKFIEAIGGFCIKLQPSEFSPVKVCLLDLGLFNNDIALMKDFLVRAIVPDLALTDQQSAFFEEMVKKVFEAEDQETRYISMKKLIAESSDSAIKSGFDTFLGSEIYAKFLDEDFLDVLKLEDILSIDLSALQSAPRLLETMTILLLLKLQSLLDGRPTIIVLDKFHTLLANEVFAKVSSSWLESLTAQNAIALLSIEDTDAAINNKCLQNCLDQFATRFFLSNKFADKHFANTFKLSEWEMTKIKSYDQHHRMFLLRQGDYSIVGVLNLSDFKDELTILSS